MVPATAPSSALQGVLEYFKTVKGWLSVAPTFVTVLDAAKGWLPISTVLKPWVYILITLLTFFAIWIEVSKKPSKPLTETQKKHMRRAAAVHMTIAIMFIGGYWILGDVFEVSTPQQVGFRSLAVFVLALLLGFVFAEISRAFAILALATD